MARPYVAVVATIVTFGGALPVAVVRRRWPWDIAPFDAGFLGAVRVTVTLIVVDRGVYQIEWAAPETWAWLGISGTLAAAGAILVGCSRRLRVTP